MVLLEICICFPVPLLDKTTDLPNSDNALGFLFLMMEDRIMLASNCQDTLYQNVTPQCQSTTLFFSNFISLTFTENQ